jgi:hypothetical protein
MTARCTSCNAHLNFRAQRGNKLANYTCNCGGKYQLLSSAPSMRAEGLQLPEGIEPYNAGGNLWIYPMTNRAGELFLYEAATRSYKPFKP